MAEKTTLHLDIVTPDKNLYSGRVARVGIPTVDGEIGVLPGHADLMARLGCGVLTLTDTDGRERRFFCRDGFVEVKGEDTSIMADVAESEGEIDAARAERARRRAEERLSSGAPDIDYSRAAASLYRALQRLSTTRSR